MHGLLSSACDPDVPVQLQRKTAPINLCRNVNLGPPDDKIFLASAPPRPESRLPPSRQLHLDVQLGAHVGHGRSSIVHALEDVKIEGLDADTVVPPLVAKIARLDRTAWLAREAWFYDEMECVQGSVVPYCFGWFEVDVASSLKATSDGPPTYNITPLEQHPVRNRDKEKDLMPVFEQEPHPMLIERARSRSERGDIIAILILERLSGEMLPVGQKVPKKTQ